MVKWRPIIDNMGRLRFIYSEREDFKETKRPKRKVDFDKAEEMVEFKKAKIDGKEYYLVPEDVFPSLLLSENQKDNVKKMEFGGTYYLIPVNKLDKKSATRDIETYVDRLFKNREQGNYYDVGNCGSSSSSGGCGSSDDYYYSGGCDKPSHSSGCGFDDGYCGTSTRGGGC